MYQEENHLLFMNKIKIQNMVKVVGFIIAFLSNVKAVQSQPLLNLNEALQLALQNNFSILIAANESKIYSIQNHAGEAGMLPMITGTGQQDNQVINTRQVFLNRTENNRDGAKSDVLNAAVEMNWTVFDGFRMFAAKNRLSELESIGKLQLTQQIERTFSRVTIAWCNVVFYQQQYQLMIQSLENSKKRIEFAELKFKAGKIARIELLKAKVDANTDEANVLKAAHALENQKASLNLLLSREPGINFTVPDSIIINESLVMDELINTSLERNSSLMGLKKMQRIELLSRRELQAQRFPTVQIRSGYSFSRSTSEAGFLQSARNNGFHYGAGISLNLFNGMTLHKRLTANKIQLESVDMMLKDSIMRIKNAIVQSYNAYKLHLALVNNEKNNVLIAEENYAIANEQFIQGVITSIELREAQLNWVSTKQRLLQAMLEAKLSETELFLISGKLAPTR
jgi:outer membrane protein TolC